MAHLWQLLQETWVKLTSVYLQSLVERMPRTGKAVIAAKGGHFDKSKVLKVFRGLFYILCGRLVFSVMNKTIAVLNLFHKNNILG